MASNQILILRSGQSLTHPGAQMKIIDLQEARKTQRRPALDKGLIMFGDISVGCVLRNVSEGGAALDIGSHRTDLGHGWGNQPNCTMTLWNTARLETPVPSVR